METNNDFKDLIQNQQQWQSKKRVILGLVLVVIGALFALRQAGVQIPNWIFSFGALFTTIGIVGAIKHNFRVGGWIIMLLIGGVFLVDEFYPLQEYREFFFPGLIILFGLTLIFRSKRNYSHRFNKFTAPASTDYTANRGENFVDATAIFGGVNRTVISKDFKGGEITAVFGGGEINLTQADINGRVEMDLTAVFGGIKLIVPQHWRVLSEASAVFGGVDDKRPIYQNADDNKLLVLKGFAIFGGIEITAY